ncbi:MAG TPA: hypothetical protein VMA97_03550 [Streptosporangiaceae bacterium]|nr:hypothetical protein [Streptosporangiaceae bacterium]
MASNAFLSWLDVKESAAAEAEAVGWAAADWLWLADPPQPLTAAAPIRASIEAEVASAGPGEKRPGQ